MPQEDRTEESQGGIGLKEREEQRVGRPPMYRVIILNDDYTPVEFVVQLVAVVFRKDAEEAARITLQVHQKGSAVAGVYTYEIAETKVHLAVSHARKHEHPLQLTMEPDE